MLFPKLTIERLRARTIPWFFGHFWKCSEVVDNYFWTLSKMAKKSRDRSCSEPSNSTLNKHFSLDFGLQWFAVPFLPFQASHLAFPVISKNPGLSANKRKIARKLFRYYTIKLENNCLHSSELQLIQIGF